MAKARRLVARYLDPTRSWDAARDGALRTLLRQDASAASLYRRAVTRHRVLVGGDPALPSGFEQNRMMAAIVSGEGPARPRQRGAIARQVAIALAAILLMALIPQLLATPASGEWLRARGVPAADLPAPMSGVGLSGVTEDGREYEIIASSAAYADDYLRISYTNERPQLDHLFILGLQPDRPSGEERTWIAPIPGEDQSLTVGAGRYSPLPFEVHLGARHTPGRLMVVAIFTEEPLLLSDVDRALDPSALDLVSSHTLPGQIAGQLSLPAGAIVQVLETTVHAGKRGEEVSP